ncbi:MAG: hypothetical protein M9887_04545 [Chitinophagales bacterium]|nr:hypothetical protein [Chitinophagales bacterium]
MKAKSIYIIVFLLFCKNLTAQDFTDIKEKKPFEISGSVGAGTNFYASNETYKSRDPFNWNLYGNVNMKIYGFELPFSFSVAQFSTSYTVPFTQLGMSPTYKWIKVHVGYRTMSLNPFVFDGQTFLGGGVELSPGKFKIGGFYGRLNKAVSEDTTADRRVEPQYSRVGYGIKAAYEGSHGSFGVQLFHAKDNEKSVKTIIDTLNTIFPQENTVIGSNWSVSIGKVLSFTGNIGVSMLNRNSFYPETDASTDLGMPGFVSKLNSSNATTTFSFAGRTGISLSLKPIKLAVNYQRIQPDYVSLGMPYTVNDVETYSATASTTLFKGKLNLNGAFNNQHNNLSKSLISEVQSRVGNLNIFANLGKHFNISGNGTLAKVEQKDGIIELSDSVKMNQMMVSYMVSPNLTFSSDNIQHNVNTTATYTNLYDKNPATADQVQGNNINVSGNYTIQFLKAFTGINTGVNYSVYGQKNLRYHSTGINVGANTQLLKEHQLGLQGSVGYFFNRSNGEKAGNNISFNLNANMSAKKHSFGLFSSYLITPPIDLNPLNKLEIVPYSVNTKNFSAGVNYSYQF